MLSISLYGGPLKSDINGKSATLEEAYSIKLLSIPMIGLWNVLVLC